MRIRFGLAILFFVCAIPVLGAARPIHAQCSPETPDCEGIYGPAMRVLLAEIAAQPTPAVNTLPVDEKVLYQRAFRKVIKSGPIYDAPGGNVIGAMEGGFQFVNAGRGQGGWVQISRGRWVTEDMLGPINTAVSKFAGATLPDGMPARPFGWILQDTQPSPTPGAKPRADAPMLERYTLVNIFAVQVIDTWEWYLVGPDQWILQTRMAKIKPVARPAEVTGRKWFAVDLFEQTLVAYEGERAVFATLIASGLAQWGTTEGVHQVWARHEQVRMSGAAGEEAFWNLPLVPWALFFTKSEQALHGAYWHDGFGYRRSRGCVNLSLTDAKWIFDWAAGDEDVWVFVYHSAEYRGGAPQ